MKMACGLTALAALLFTPMSARAADLTLTLTTRGDGGRIAVAVHSDAEGFRSGKRPVRTIMVPRTGPVTTVILTGLPPGRYAVAVFHDTDANGTLTLWPIGLPREAYGFSRDARGRFGPPAFEAAAFDLPAGGARQAIRLH